MGLITEGQYVPIDKLSKTEKALLLLPQIYFHFVVFSLLSCLISYDQPVVFSLLYQLRKASMFLLISCLKLRRHSFYYLRSTFILLFFPNLSCLISYDQPVVFSLLSFPLG
jgi:hypothetical protein